MTGARPARDAILRTTTPPMSFRPHPTRTTLDLMAASQPTPNQANTGGETTQLHTNLHNNTQREPYPTRHTHTNPTIPRQPPTKKTGQDPLQNKETPT